MPYVLNNNNFVRYIGDHYNALRLSGESELEPAKSLRLDNGVPKGTAAASATTGTIKFEDETSSLKGQSEQIKMIIISTGCNNINHIESLLDACDNDVESCIEILLNEKKIGEDWESDAFLGSEIENEKSSSNNIASKNLPASSASSSQKESQKKLTTKEKKEAKKQEKAAVRKKQAEEAKKEEVKKLSKEKKEKKEEVNDDDGAKEEQKTNEPLIDMVGSLQI